MRKSQLLFTCRSRADERALLHFHALALIDSDQATAGASDLITAPDTVIPGDFIFPALQNSAFTDLAVTKYSLEPGLADAPFALVMSQARYDGLSPELQSIIDETTGPDRAEWFGKMLDEGENAGRQYLVDGGVTMVSLSEDQISGLKSDFAPIVDAAVASAGKTSAAAADFLTAYTE